MRITLTDFSLGPDVEPSLVSLWSWGGVNGRQQVSDRRGSVGALPWRVTVGTLRNWRAMRIGPAFVKIGKAVLYPVRELDAWDQKNLVICDGVRARLHGRT